MEIFTGSIELQLLFWSVVLGLVQLVIATTLATKDQGLAYNLSPRDLPAPPVTALVKESELSALGAHLDFWARLLYVPVYAAAIPLARRLVQLWRRLMMAFSLSGRCET